MLQFYPSFGYCKNAKLLELGCVDIMRERERERQTDRQRERELSSKPGDSSPSSLWSLKQGATFIAPFVASAALSYLRSVLIQTLFKKKWYGITPCKAEQPLQVM